LKRNFPPQRKLFEKPHTHGGFVYHSISELLKELNNLNGGGVKPKDALNAHPRQAFAWLARS